MRASLIFPILILAAAASALSAQEAVESESAGVLDRPMPPAPNTNTNEVTVVSTPEPVAPVRPDIAQQNLQEEFEQEQQVLEQLPEQELQDRADQGERAAQVVLAENFAMEASMLAFAPEAANDALSDAVKWYSRAAMRGFPGAPSLDKAGVQFFPIRVQRIP